MSDSTGVLKVMKLKLLTLICCTMAACDVVDPRVDTQMTTPTPPPIAPMPETALPRFRVERVGVFKDDIAYGSTRGIYLIHDARTGREFIGVSGVGVTETRMEGKITTDH